MAAVVNESVRGRPSAALRPYVAAYHGYRQRGVPPTIHRGLPSPYLTLIFTLDEPLDIVQHVDPRRPPCRYRTLLGGLHTSPALIRHGGAQSGIQLLVRPLGARMLFGLPAGELAGVDVDAENVLGPLAARVHQRLAEAADWPARFAVLDTLLGALLREQPDVSAEVRYAWDTLLRTRGDVPVAELARAVGWSDRNLAKRFAVELGLTPKAAARVIRFDRARRALQTAAPHLTTLADLAADFGYYDQSHLVREFRALAGLPPTRWLAAEFGNVQAGGGQPN